jgi:hypothetical protein
MNLIFKKILFLPVSFIPALIAVHSCIKPVDDFDLRKKDPKIVMNAILNPDSVLHVHLSRSIGTLDKEEITWISDANVSVYEGNMLITTLDSFKNGYYFKSGFRPTENKEYRITAMADGFKPVTSTIKTMQKINIEKVDTVKRFIRDGWNDEYYVYEVGINFRDPADGNNYYIVEIKKNMYRFEYYNPENTIPVIDTVIYTGLLSLMTKDNQVEMTMTEHYVAQESTSNMEVYKYGTGLIFTDKLFNGENYTIKVLIKEGDLWTPYSTGTFDFLEISLKSISEELYLFLKSYSMYNIDPLNRFFQESVTLYTNVENGLGLVASMAESDDTSLICVSGY